MRLLRMAGLLAVSILLLAQPGFSQDTLSLTLEQSVALALEHNPELAVSRNDYENRRSCLQAGQPLSKGACQRSWRFRQAEFRIF
jgi:hypothetical protein